MKKGNPLLTYENMWVALTPDGTKVITYEHEVNLYLERLVFKSVVYFSYQHNIPLLGRDGFFNLFKRVDFNERKKTVTFKL